MNLFNHNSWVAVVTLTDRPKFARNRCVIEVSGGVYVLSRFFLFFFFFVGVGNFCISRFVCLFWFILVIFSYSK